MITLRSVCKVFDLAGITANALDNVSLTINRGEYVAIAGPSGSGKSTLLDILGILDTASSGRYLLEDYDITAVPEREGARIRNKHFGFLFRSFNLLSGLTALENVMLPMSLAGMPPRRRRERAEALLREVGLEGAMGCLPVKLPGGEQQRVAIARALANDPDLILADEPTGDLQSGDGEEILTMLESLNAKGMTIVIATHNPEIGERARRVVGMLDGRIVRDEIRAQAVGEPGLSA